MNKGYTEKSTNAQEINEKTSSLNQKAQIKTSDYFAFAHQVGKKI